MVAARKDCNNDQYLGAFGPSAAASFDFMVVVDSRDMGTQQEGRSSDLIATLPALNPQRHCVPNHDGYDLNCHGTACDFEIEGDL
jgi:hypothetical protein